MTRHIFRPRSGGQRRSSLPATRSNERCELERACPGLPRRPFCLEAARGWATGSGVKRGRRRDRCREGREGSRIKARPINLNILRSRPSEASSPPAPFSVSRGWVGGGRREMRAWWGRRRLRKSRRRRVCLCVYFGAGAGSKHAAASPQAAAGAREPESCAVVRSHSRLTKEEPERDGLFPSRAGAARTGGEGRGGAWGRARPRGRNRARGHACLG